MNKLKISTIGEIGVNHDNSLTKAKKLIRIAKKNSMTYVKFQTYVTENLIMKNTELANYQKINQNKINNQFDLLKKYELSYDEISNLKKYCKNQNIKFLSSVFDYRDLIFLYDIGCRKIKIPSGEMNNFQLLKLASKMKIKLIISLGMASNQEIRRTMNFLSKNQFPRKNITLLHCVSDYPANLNSLNLRYINILKKEFPFCNIGYSDHAIGSLPSVLAISQGARIIEKHITINRSDIGPDHKASLDQKQLSFFMKDLFTAINILGIPKKMIQKEELNNKKLVRKSIYASTPIQKGELFTEKNICLKRPFVGLPADYWFKYINKKSKKKYSNGDKI